MVDRNDLVPLVSGGLSAKAGDIADLSEGGGLSGYTTDDAGHIVPAADGLNYPEAFIAGAQTADGGGNAHVIGGSDAGGGAGSVFVKGGNSNTTSIPGGTVQIQGGTANTGDANGGDIDFITGIPSGSGTPGNINLTLQSGSIIDIEGAISTPGTLTATMTTSPKVGNPTMWLTVTLNGTVCAIPAWAV